LGINFFECCKNAKFDFIHRIHILKANLLIVRLGLERGASAEEALQVITTLLETHGQVRGRPLMTSRNFGQFLTPLLPIDKLFYC
jgi:hypothetical protein